jgi:hypothetical protein
MAHFAKIENQTVTQVIVLDNLVCAGEFPHSEAAGAKYIQDVLQLPGEWLQTSYNHNFRKHYAGVGYTYNSQWDQFVPPQPYPSWSYDPESGEWIAPVACLGNQWEYDWDEDSQQWVTIAQ